MGRTCILLLVFNGHRTRGNIPVKNREINLGKRGKLEKNNTNFAQKGEARFLSCDTKLWVKFEELNKEPRLIRKEKVSRE